MESGFEPCRLAIQKRGFTGNLGCLLTFVLPTPRYCPHKMLMPYAYMSLFPYTLQQTQINPKPN